jgi:hypothetical protein
LECSSAIDGRVIEFDDRKKFLNDERIRDVESALRGDKIRQRSFVIGIG